MTLFKELESATTGTRRDLRETLDALPWNAQGLLPCIAQQHDSGEVLMLAWMNRDALEETLQTARVCYYSRSRGQLWRKGEQSGQVQRLRELRLDCDGDTLLAQVDQTGPACHTGRRSCFYHQLDETGLTVRSAPDVDPADLYGR